MLWLQPRPWGRWIAVGLIASIAVWVEFRPDPMVDHQFATEDIRAGDLISASNTETRRVPAGLLDPPGPGDIALRGIAIGSPILAADAGEVGSVVPEGWWILAIEVAPSARPGNPVKLVLLDTGVVVDGVVATPSSDDPFGVVTGGVAVSAAVAGEVAVAAANGRIAILISTG